jgi:PD-(D/E)XK nuclease superfamily
MTTVIRVSSLANYPDCPRRGAARLFRCEVTQAGFSLRYLPRGIGALIGTAVHRGVSVVLGHKASTGTLPLRTVAIESSREALRDGVDRVEVQYDTPHGATHNMRDAVDQVVRMTGVYHDHVAPSIDPVIVEERLEAEVETGLVLSGQSDMICREPGAIRDLKTGAKMPTSHAPQLGGYSLLARSHGHRIERASIDFVQRVSPAKPQPLPVTDEAVVAHAETAATNILRQMAIDIDTFRKGDPARRILPGDPWAFMANPASVLCSAKWCSAWGTEFCHEGKRSNGK